ncbi:MAG: hypothetical protein LBG52_04900 [Candidatus Peribacteria bacterium]|nr:hypothetical protein [Candidatus Peribacteria bacterium]
MVDYLALIGDIADNVKGVVGIGDKKALHLIQTYQTIEKIYEHLDELDAGMVKILTEGKVSAFASKTLIQLAHVAEVADIPLATFKFSLDYNQALHTLCDNYGFQGFRKTLTDMKKEAEMPQQLGLF